MSLLGEHMGRQHVLRGEHAQAASSYSASRPQNVHRLHTHTDCIHSKHLRRRQVLTQPACGGGMYSLSQHTSTGGGGMYSLSHHALTRSAQAACGVEHRPAQAVCALEPLGMSLEPVKPCTNSGASKHVLWSLESLVLGGMCSRDSSSLYLLWASCALQSLLNYVARLFI